MNTKVNFRNIAFMLCIAVGFVSCSSNENFEDTNLVAKSKINLKENKAFANALTNVIGNISNETMYLVYDLSTNENMVVEEKNYDEMMFYYILINSVRENQTKEVTSNNKIKREKNKDKWTFYRNAKGKVSSVKPAYDMAQALPKNETIETKIVPQEDGAIDVYYRILD